MAVGNPPYRPAHPRIFSAARTVVSLGLLYQVAGLARLLVIARYFGAGPLLDAYYLGQVVPAFLIGLSTALLQTIFIPAYVEALARDDGTEATTIRNGSLTWTALLLGLAAAVIWVGEPLVLDVLWPGIDPAIQSGLRIAFGVLVWTTPLNGLIDAIGLTLNAEGRFTAAASAPLANVIVSVTVLILWPEKGLDALMISLFAGLAAQAVVLILAATGAGIRLLPRLNIGSAFAASAVAIGLPIFIFSVLTNAIPAFIQIVAARAGPGAVSALGYANRLQQSVLQAIVMSVSIVLLPHFARLVAERRDEELRATLRRVFAAATVFSFATVAFIAVGGESTVDFLMQRGRFTAADGHLVSSLWLALTVGLLGTTWTIFLTRLFQAKQLPWVITQLSVLSVAMNVIFALVLFPRYGVEGVALANSIAYTVLMAASHIRALRFLKRLLDGTTRSFVLLAFVANAAAYVGAMAWQALVKGDSPLLGIAGQVAIIAGCNIFVLRRPPLGLSARALLRI